VRGQVLGSAERVDVGRDLGERRGPVLDHVDPAQERYKRTRDKLRQLLLDGKLEDREVEVEVPQNAPMFDVLASQGARIAIQGFARDEPGQPGRSTTGEAVLGELRAVDPDVVFIEADFAEATAAERVVAAAVAARGRLDILIANHARSTVNSLDDVTAAELDLSFAVNTRGSILLAPRRVVLLAHGDPGIRDHAVGVRHGLGGIIGEQDVGAFALDLGHADLVGVGEREGDLHLGVVLADGIDFSADVLARVGGPGLAGADPSPRQIGAA